MTLYMHEQDIMRKSRAEGKQEGEKSATELAIRNMLKKWTVDDIVEIGYERGLVEKIAKEKSND